MSGLPGGKDGQALPLVVFKNDSLGGRGDKRLGNGEAGEWNGLSNDRVRWPERAIAKSKVQVRKGFWRRGLFARFFIGKCVRGPRDQQEEKEASHDCFRNDRAQRRNFLRVIMDTSIRAALIVESIRERLTIWKIRDILRAFCRDAQGHGPRGRI